MAYGNGTKTNYTYEPERRRLKGMEAESAAGRKFMDNDYQYDAVNNILSLENKAEVPSSDLMGGSSSYTYEYDDLYRLTSAQGEHTGSNSKDQYTLGMQYNTVGGITNKNQFHEKSGGDGGSFKKQGKTSYELDYTYGTEQPNAPTKIGDNSYSYDANGNQTGWKSNISGQQREILWDEENRIRAIADNGSAYHYVYDAWGERVLKGKSTGQAVYKNGEKKAGNGSMGNYTVYVNPYLVLQTGGYTKHYFIEGQRIVSKIGGGIDGRGQGPLKAGNDKIDYAAKAESLFEGIVRNEKFIDEDGNLLTAGKSGKVPPGQIIGNSGNNGQSEPFRYFFHPDHLGSTSYITDATGEVYQHLEYFAFGETFVEERGNTDKLPFKFNGKELDEETGLYYYGARYYDAQTSVWLSVDPMADAREWVSPYNFVQNNPVNRVDPDGALDFVLNGEGDIYWDDNATSQATTKEGETYLGEDLTFEFNSYIDKSFDGPQPPWEVTGDKLTSTITVDATKNSDGSLKSVDVTSDYFVHETGGISMFKGRNYFPGLGSNQNKAISLTGVRSFNATFEQHASVPGFEAAGLSLLGFDVVNVAQRMNMNLSGNQLSITAGTDVFPSATLNVNGKQLFQYNQPSFRATHGRNSSFSDNGRGGVDVITTPRRPAPSFYKRYPK